MVRDAFQFINLFKRIYAVVVVVHCYWAGELRREIETDVWELEITWRGVTLTLDAWDLVVMNVLCVALHIDSNKDGPLYPHLLHADFWVCSCYTARSRGVTRNLEARRQQQEEVLCDRKMTICALARGVWGHAPPRKFWILDLLRSFLVQSWGEITKVGWRTAEPSQAFKMLAQWYARMQPCPQATPSLANAKLEQKIMLSTPYR